MKGSNEDGTHGVLIWWRQGCVCLLSREKQGLSQIVSSSLMSQICMERGDSKLSARFPDNFVMSQWWGHWVGPCVSGELAFCCPAVSFPASSLLAVPQFQGPNALIPQPV